MPARVITSLKGRADIGLLLLMVAGVNLLPHGDPTGIKGLGVVQGALFAMQALGILLVVRSSRVINFAQVQIGALVGVVFYELVNHAQLVLLVRNVCPGCLPSLPGDAAYFQSHPAAFTSALLAAHAGGWLAFNFWASLVLALVIGPLLSFAVYRFVISHFDDAPRLIATVATIAVAQVIGFVTSQLSHYVFQDAAGSGAGGPIRLPFPEVHLRLPGDSVIFDFGEVAAVVAAVLLCVALVGFFRGNGVGVVVRAASELPQRAQTLGIKVRTMSSVIWAASGFLAGMASILLVVGEGGSTGQNAGFDVAGMAPILAAAVFARMASLPLGVLAAVCIGVLQEAFFWNTQSSVPFEGILLALIVGGLFAQRTVLSRAEEEATAGYLAAREARPIPRELRNLPRIQAYVRWFGIAVGALVIGLPFLLSPGQVSLASTVVIMAIVGVSLLVLTGWAGQISLGQFGIAGIGAFAAAGLRGAGLDIVPCVILGGLAAAVAAAVLGLSSLRLRGLYLAVTTVAFALVVADVFVNGDFLGAHLPPTVDRPVFFGIDLGDEKTFLYFCFVWLGLAVGAVMGLRRSRIARALVALRDNESAGQCFGLNLVRIRVTAFVLSGFIAGTAGALFAFHQHAVQRIDYLPQASIDVFLMVIIGGLGSVAGPLLGALYLAVLTFLGGPFTLLGTGAGVLAVMLLAPGGLSSLAFRVRDQLLRRYALRHRIAVPSLGTEDVSADDRRAPMAPRRVHGQPVTPPARYRLANTWTAFRPPVDV